MSERPRDADLNAMVDQAYASEGNHSVRKLLLEAVSRAKEARDERDGHWDAIRQYVEAARRRGRTVLEFERLEELADGGGSSE